MSKTKIYTMRINFFWDDGDDIQEFRIIVPENIAEDEVKAALFKSHEILSNGGIDENDKLYGRCETCKHYGKGIYCNDCSKGSEYECNAEDLYGTVGRTPVALLDYMCEKYGWKWEDFEFDIDLNFN